VEAAQYESMDKRNGRVRVNKFVDARDAFKIIELRNSVVDVNVERETERENQK
jgi:hypothetical protein